MKSFHFMARFLAMAELKQALLIWLNENGVLRELGKPKQILHIGILLDGLDGLLIAQPLWHASLSEHQQPCGRTCCLHRCVGSSVACCIPALSCPREDCQQASPSQTRERLLKLKQLVIVVLGVVFHVGSC